LPEGTPVTLQTLKALANRPLDPGKGRAIKKITEGVITFNPEEGMYYKFPIRSHSSEADGTIDLATIVARSMVPSASEE
jgi:hypothetical protein